MNIAFLTPCILFVSSADQPATLDGLAPHASGVALAEVVGIEEFDQRPMDGNKGIRFKLKRVRGTGTFHDTIRVVTVFGGLRPPGRKPDLPGPVRPDSLKKGDRVWFAFSSDHDDKYPQWVIGFWPEKDKVAMVLDAAVEKDLLKWQPQYDPKIGLSYGHVVERDHIKLRVEKAGKVLWEAAVPGKLSEFDRGLWLWVHPSEGYPETMPRCGKYLGADTATRLGKDNELGLPADTYRVSTAFDPETGGKLAVWVALNQGPHVAVLHRGYDPASGKPTREERFDLVESGGKAVGAERDRWYRKIARTFDTKTGKAVKEEVFRYDEKAESDNRWVKVAPRK